MFNRSAIMKAAWAMFREENTFNGVLVFGADGRRDFGRCLRRAWHDARAAAGALTHADVALVERTAAIRSEMENLKWKHGRYDVAGMHDRLQSELFRLTA